MNQDGRRLVVYRHDGRASQQTAELHRIAHLFARGGDDANGGGFAVDHADCGFVGNDGRNGFGSGVFNSLCEVNVLLFHFLNAVVSEKITFF